MTGRSTIFALSSGSPPAGIAVVRISGPQAGIALETLTGRRLPAPRLATLVTLKDPVDGNALDRALVLWFPGPASATAEDVAELHLHGGRAVVAAVLNALSLIAGLYPAEPGAFTRRAFENGCIDLAEAEGLGDLLRAETEAQRRNAMAQAGGALGRLIADWQNQLAAVAAHVEAAIDFSDEDDVREAPLDAIRAKLAEVRADIDARLADPPAERLRDGIRVAIIGPPNSGKSTLLNALVSRDAAIVSPLAGTTRDVIEVPVIFGGLPMIFIDTAGIRAGTDDIIERIGIARAIEQSRIADIVLALGNGSVNIPGAVVICICAKSDLGLPTGSGLAVSAQTGSGLVELTKLIVKAATLLLPPPDSVALNQRHRAALLDAIDELSAVDSVDDELLIAEHLRSARNALGRVTGGGDVDEMLDALFGSFCIGK